MGPVPDLRKIRLFCPFWELNPSNPVAHLTSKTWPDKQIGSSNLLRSQTSGLSFSWLTSFGSPGCDIWILCCYVEKKKYICFFTLHAVIHSAKQIKTSKLRYHNSVQRSFTEGLFQELKKKKKMLIISIFINAGSLFYNILQSYVIFIWWACVCLAHWLNEWVGGGQRVVGSSPLLLTAYSNHLVMKWVRFKIEMHRRARGSFIFQKHKCYWTLYGNICYPNAIMCKLCTIIYGIQGSYVHFFPFS